MAPTRNATHSVAGGERSSKMYYTYVLNCSDNKDKLDFYVGYCKDLRVRISEHKSGKVKTTKKFVKIDLIYYEACLNKTDARKRELQLKTGFGRGYINRRLSSYMRV